MNQLTSEEIAQLARGGVCYVHEHPREEVTFTNRLELMRATPVVEVSSDYTPARTDEVVIVDTTLGDVTLTLPAASRGREFRVVNKVAGNTLTVLSSGSDVIYGPPGSPLTYNIYVSLHFKAIAGGYVTL